MVMILIFVFRDSSGCISVFSRLVCLRVLSGPSAAFMVIGKTRFNLDLTEPQDLPAFSRAQLWPSNKPKSDARDKRRIKIILNHFRDKPAPFAMAMSAICIISLVAGSSGSGHRG